MATADVLAILVEAFTAANLPSEGHMLERAVATACEGDRDAEREAYLLAARLVRRLVEQGKGGA